ncbi:ABC transporter ATP-binding protein [Clostridium sp.]|uniref:ABC transporter ATP-binding protein n=1 Tax=Clostridium sp. TaxID=1506 RepID=UPI0025C22DD9|nr:ABC transporter ATP-binding protein [Clostridium sp.]
MAYINYITQILLSLIVFSQLIVILTKGATSANRVLEILNIEPSITDSNVNNNIHHNKESSLIEFKNVSFSYSDSNEYSLKDINLTINKNETIGIIGGTGSGKSTLVNLIPRFYDVTSGEILVKGNNTKDYKLKDLRKLIGIVPQKAVLFKGSILENLKWGKEDADINAINEALEISQSKSFVDSLPEKYNSPVLQGGKNFSGGQKQRLTIARALISKPEILILDDSSSALDFATDAGLRKALKEKTKDTTVLIVSQRVSSIRNADKIVVLDNGEIKGIGTHDYLLKNCEVYSEIYSSQLNN